MRWVNMPLAARNNAMVVTSVGSHSFLGKFLYASKDPVDVRREGFESPDLVNLR